MASVIYHIYSCAVARDNCTDTNNSDWYDRHDARLYALVNEFLPSGSGFDNGTSLLDWCNRKQRVRFKTSFHHMNDVGIYCGWTDHIITVRPAFDGLTVDVGGRNANGIKGYIQNVFYTVLSSKIDFVTFCQERGL